MPSIAGLAVDVLLVVLTGSNGTNGWPVAPDRSRRNSSNILVQAAACTLAVFVSTPSRSNRHPRMPSGSPSTHQPTARVPAQNHRLGRQAHARTTDCVQDGNHRSRRPRMSALATSTRAWRPARPRVPRAEVSGWRRESGSAEPSCSCAIWINQSLSTGSCSGLEVTDHSPTAALLVNGDGSQLVLRAFGQNATACAWLDRAPVPDLDDLQQR